MPSKRLKIPKTAHKVLKILQENIGRNIDKNGTHYSQHTRENTCASSSQKLYVWNSDVNYTKFYLTSGQRVMVTKTLKEYDEMLSGNGFIRAHQSHLVNSEHIVEFVKADGGQINLTDGSYVPVSSRRRAVVMQALEDL